jgi:hypothetical protein
VLLLVVYTMSNPGRDNFYNHFVWQAAAWLDGEASIPYPVYETDGLPHANWYFQDVLEIRDAGGDLTGRALIPFPPLPALVILPFVALWGLATDAQLIATILGALDVGLAFWLIGRLTVRPAVRLATSIFFGLGTVFWYTSMLGTTWYLAHVVAVGLTLLALGVALGADRDAVEDAADLLAPGTAAVDEGADYEELPDEPIPAGFWPLDGRQFLAGFLLGLAATARLPMIFGAPFLVLVGSGGSWFRRGVSAALGAAVPIAGLLLYNLATTGELVHPAYEYLYRVESGFYPLIYPYLHYHYPEWAIEDPRYIPQNLGLMLSGLPEILPACTDPAAVRRLFDEACTWLRPRADGMSLLLTSPFYLLALPALRAYGRSRLVTGAVIAIGAIAVINLMHFSQGWVQFGYRFSNDFAPFALLLVALGMERRGGFGFLVALLLAASIAVNWWGVQWGVLLQW